jgi:D-alanyl-D-alanine carboxypeptidase/D-alanyl-D-alanine-endopeptidase (penicillin-binding protein 4)
MRDLGIQLGGQVKVGAVKPEIKPLALHESQPLSIIIRSSNKDSNNFVAERIFQTVGAELYGAPATTAKGQRAVIEYLTQLGMRPGTFHPTNGSGLAHTNRITPSSLTTLLRHLYFDMSIAPDFLQSLAVAGIDGTIKNRFTGSRAHGFVRAKTGTLNGVSALSGYVGHREDVLAFAIMNQGFRGRRLNDVRRAQVRMVNAMMTFLRGGGDDTSHEAAPMDIESTVDETVDLPQNMESKPEPQSQPEAPRPSRKTLPSK